MLCEVKFLQHVLSFQVAHNTLAMRNASVSVSGGQYSEVHTEVSSSSAILPDTPDTDY